MDATPSFGVTMISEVPSNPQLTLGIQLLNPMGNLPFKKNIELSSLQKTRKTKNDRIQAKGFALHLIL